MVDRLSACLVPETGTVRDAMATLDHGARQIALAVDEQGRLVGVVTDGDLRRALLGGAALGDPIGPRLTRRFVFVTPGEGRPEVLDLMRARRVSAVPVLDADRRPVGLHLLQAFVAAVERPNWAVIMAGGQGVRLRPLTDQVPKPMLSVAGRPILERLILHLAASGIRRVFVSVNYLGHVIEDHFGDGSAFGCRIEYLRETEPLGTAGSLSLLPPPADPVLVMNGDLVTSADVGRLLEFHEAGGFHVSIGIRRYLHAVPFGCVEREGDRVTGLEEKPTLSREVNTGIYALAPAFVSLVPADRASSMPGLIGEAIGRGDPVGAFEVEGDWIDVGQREQLDRARGGS